MKKTVLLLAVVLCIGVFLTNCGKSSNLPAYARGEGSYFNDPAAGFSAIYGKIDSVSEEIFLKYGEFNRKAKVKGYRTLINGQQIYLIFEEKHWGYDDTKNLFSNDELSIHALVAQNTDKNYPLKETCNYSDTYFFVNDEELTKAIQKFNDAPKTKNLPSQYKIEEYQKNKGRRKGSKTYHATIVSVVEYIGRRDVYYERMLSLYLSCGTVVQLYTEENMKYLFDDELVFRIDCVTNDDNKVIDYTIN